MRLQSRVCDRVEPSAHCRFILGGASSRRLFIAAALALFETAVAQALIVAGLPSDKSRDWSNSSATTAWQTLQPDEIADPRKRNK